MRDLADQTQYRTQRNTVRRSHQRQIRVVAVQRDSNPDHVESGIGVREGSGRIGGVNYSGFDSIRPEFIEYCAKVSKLPGGVWIVRVIGDSEMGEHTSEFERGEVRDFAGQGENVGGLCADPVHPCVDFNMYTYWTAVGDLRQGPDLANGVHGWREIERDDIGLRSVREL